MTRALPRLALLLASLALAPALRAQLPLPADEHKLVQAHDYARARELAARDANRAQGSARLEAQARVLAYLLAGGETQQAQTLLGEMRGNPAATEADGAATVAMGQALGWVLRGHPGRAVRILDAAAATAGTTHARLAVARAQAATAATDWAAAQRLLAAVDWAAAPPDLAAGAYLWQAWLAAQQSNLPLADSALAALAGERLKKAAARHPDAYLADWARAHLAAERRQPAQADKLHRHAAATAARATGKRSAAVAEVLAAAGTDLIALGDDNAFLQHSRDLDALLAARQRLLDKAAEAKNPAKYRVPDDWRVALAAAELALAHNNMEKSRALVNRALRSLRAERDTVSLHRVRAYLAYVQGDLHDGRNGAAALYLAEARRGTDTLAPGTNLWYARTTGYQARILAAKYDLEAASAAYDQALAASAAQRKPSHPAHIALLLAQSDALMTQRAFRRAETALAEVLRQQQTRYGERSYPVAMTADRLGKLHLDEGNFFPAGDRLTLALTTLRALPQEFPLEEALVLEHQALLAQAKGEYKLAEDLYVQAIRIRRKKLGIKGDEAVGSASKVAELYIRQGRYSDALKILQQAVSVFEKAKRTDQEYTDALASLANLYLQTGQYKEAEQTARRQRDLVRSVWRETSAQYADANILLARVVSAMGRYQEANDLLQAALRTYRGVYQGANLNTAKLQALVAENAYLRGQYADAARELTGALTQTEQAVGRRHLDYAVMQAQLAEVYIAQQQFSQADTLLDQVLVTQKALLGDKHPSFLRTEGIVATLYRLTGAYNQADQTYRHLLKNWKAELGEKHPEYAFYQADYADLQYRRGQVKAARKTYDAAIAGLMGLVQRYFPALSEQEKTEFWAKIGGKLERFYLYALDESAKQPALLGMAYDLRLRTKALLLTQSTAIRNRINNSQDLALKAMFETWQSRREYLAKLYTLSKTELKALNEDIGSVEEEVNRLERQLSEQSEFFRTATDTLTPTWQAVRSRLASNEAAVEILRLGAGKVVPGDSVVYAALIVDAGTQKAPRAVMLPDGKLMDRRYLLHYSRSIANRFEDRLSYGRFWEAIEQATQGRNTVYLSTDGVYNQISIPALRRRDGNYVLDVQQIHFVANTRDLLSGRIRNFYDGRTALLVGNPEYQETTGADLFYVPELAGTGTEVRAINRVLSAEGWATEVLTRDNANEELLKRNANPKLLHIATHGFFYPLVSSTEGVETASAVGVGSTRAAQNPLLRSGLLLSGAAQTLSATPGSGGMSTSLEDNGIITAYEVMNLNLANTELVVLSACETGLGEVRNGEGVYGLQRAFAVAGAKAIVMSLWRVNDAVTQELVTRFYENWVRNPKDIHAAFREAQMAVRQQYPEPYYWGAFVLQGE